ncbi:hypothetical protein EDB86DRAFT_2884579, partial [Lactarius hatsudake]
MFRGLIFLPAEWISTGLLFLALRVLGIQHLAPLSSLLLLLNHLLPCAITTGCLFLLVLIFIFILTQLFDGPIVLSERDWIVNPPIPPGAARRGKATMKNFEYGGLPFPRYVSCYTFFFTRPGPPNRHIHATPFL